MGMWPRLPKFPKLPEWQPSLNSYYSASIKISKITQMSKINWMINWFIIWPNDPDYQNFPNYLYDHNPWTHIILKQSRFPKLPKYHKLPIFPDPVPDSLSHPIASQPLDSYHFQMNWIAKITLISQISLSYCFIIWAYDSDDQNFPNYPYNHEHLNDLSKLLR